jgi:hypothetical protein
MGGFAVRHKVSLDWLLIGDLQGLRRMPMQQSPSILTATTVVKLCAELTMEQRRKLSLMIAGLLDEAVSSSAVADCESELGSGWRHTATGSADNKRGRYGWRPLSF